MKLSRNKIRKIRKQQHQSVRRWKRPHHRSSATFRKSRRYHHSGGKGKSGSVYTPKLMNRTLKKYVSDHELRELKDKYRKLRREKRKRCQQVGGKVIPQELLQAAATAAAIAAAQTVLQMAEPQLKQPPSEDSMLNASDNNASAETTTTAETTPIDAGADAGAASTEKTPKSDDTKKPPFKLGLELEGDISVGMEEHECNDEKQVSKLVSFLIEKGLPYYIQIQLKSGDKPLDKNDTNIFDLRRILYGKFTDDIKKIDENKRGLYLEETNTVGVANSELYGNNEPGIFIYTGEKGQILKDSKDDSIQVRLLQSDPDAPPIPSLTDSTRLYKIKWKDLDFKPYSIDTTKFLTNLDKYGKIDMSEFRLQVAPMTPAELKKDAQNVAAAARSDNPQAKVVVDESNTYIVNLNVGCKVVSIQTLKKSLEKARLSLEDKKDASKQSALDVFLMLSSLLQNPEFANSDGYNDFKESVFSFSYKIEDSERLYGFTQLQIFFDDKKDVIPPRIIKEFFKLLNLLGHGPAGTNGDCLRFDGVMPTINVLQKMKTLEKDGKIVTITTETLENTTNMNGLMNDISKIGDSGKKSDDADKGADEGADKGSGDKEKIDDETGATTSAGEGTKETPVEGADAEAAASEEAAISAETEAGVATAPPADASETTENPNLRPLTIDQIKEVDAIESSFGKRYKAYVIRQFIFNDKSKDLKNINLVHFMGWGTDTAEYIPEPESATRILERDENTETGQNTFVDDTVEKVMKLYENADMSKLEEKARKKAEEYEKEVEYSRQLMATAAATAGATASAQILSKNR